MRCFSLPVNSTEEGEAYDRAMLCSHVCDRAVAARAAGLHLDALATTLYQHGDTPDSMRRAGDQFGRWLSQHGYAIAGRWAMAPGEAVPRLMSAFKQSGKDAPMGHPKPFAVVVLLQEKGSDPEVSPELIYLFQQVRANAGFWEDRHGVLRSSHRASINEESTPCMPSPFYTNSSGRSVP